MLLTLPKIATLISQKENAVGLTLSGIEVALKTGPWEREIDDHKEHRVEVRIPATGG
jgi:hypothetical protein